MDSLFSSTLDTVAPLRLRKIKEKSPTPCIMSTLAPLREQPGKWCAAGGKQNKMYFVLLGSKVPYPTEKH